MDELIKKIAGFGVPGIVLVVAMGATGLSGAAAITAGLALLGPGGMIGGIAILGIAGLISHTIAEYGVDAVVKAVCKEQLKTKSKEEVIAEIEKIPFTKKVKLKAIDAVKKA
ncbi:hypothetical protein [Lactococcus termiticola]|uniref:Uncharacterized protein n=1 Tax=Lactococcus termiticola TaxID=2169526 RepID=A0A2R5HKJ6_9LACT|nr:hypothetical protein [Lactococcus termiticola]GBG97400.1 hypothetical protein NtB2_01540 [Lactococcus termiticola]